MKTSIKILLILALCIFCTNCTKETTEVLEAEVAQTCETNNSSFRQLYGEMLQTDPILQQEASYDFEVHGYTFQVASNKQICSIGYQSYAADPDISYKIEIIENSTNSQIYNGDHIFSQTDISYIQLDTPVTILANSTYTIKRTQEINVAGAGVIGNIIYKYDNQQYLNFLPYTFGDLTILTSGTDVFINDTTPYNSNSLDYLPIIDIVFLE